MNIQPPPGADPSVWPIGKEFMFYVYDMVASYLDTKAGLQRVCDEVVRFQRVKIEEIKATQPERANVEFFDEMTLTHLFAADATRPDEPVHFGTQGDIKRRTADGRDAMLIGNMFITFLYGAWEEKYRGLLATAMGLSNKSELKSDVFGDLGQMRHAAVHNNMIATQKVEDAKVLRMFDRGEAMLLPAEAVIKIFGHIDAEITRWCKIG